MPKKKDELGKMLTYLMKIMGKEHTTLLVAILCDSIDKFVFNTADHERIESVEIKYNDKISLFYDCKQDRYIEKGAN